MTREFKFRAWDGKEMHYNIVPWQWDFVISTMFHKCVESTGSGIFGIGGATAKMEVPAIRFETIMQFTGVRDVDGKEIYEGDIIKHGGSIRIIEYRWSNFSAIRICGSETILLSFCEAPIVIGNIYQNPELILNK